MNKDDFEKKLENLSKPQLPQTHHQQQLKLSILSAKKSARASLWLLLIPFLIFIGRLLQDIFNIPIPPGSWLQALPSSLRITIFIIIVIVIPLTTVILNLLSITWLQYDREQEVLNISIRMRMINLIIIIVAGLVALLFIAVMITDR
jgi:hypothetical protein